MTELAADCDQFVAAAAMIGGISYFHEFAYDLLAENERILASTFDAAIAAHRAGASSGSWSCQLVDGLRVGDRVPDAGRRPATSPPPISTYGFQKLASEYFAEGRGSSTSCRTRSCGRSTASGIGERRAQRDTDIMCGNVKLALSPRRARSRAEGPQGPGPAAHPRRRPTRSGTTRTAATWPTVSGWRWSRRRRGQRRLQPVDRARRRRSSSWRGHLAQDPRPGRPLRFVSDPPFEHDVQLRVPDVRKATRGAGLRGDDLAGPMLDEVIPWIATELEAGRL